MFNKLFKKENRIWIGVIFICAFLLFKNIDPFTTLDAVLSNQSLLEQQIIDSRNHFNSIFEVDGDTLKVKKKNLDVPNQVVTNHLYADYKIKIGGHWMDGNEMKRTINTRNVAGFAIDGGGSTWPLFEGSRDIHGNAHYSGWSNDRWDIVYINRGWKVKLREHALDNSGGGEQEVSNTDSWDPKKVWPNFGGNKVSSYVATWIGW